MKIMLEPGAYMPERMHKSDAGLDIKTKHGQRIMPHSSAIFRTGVHVELPEGTAGIIMSRSGLNIKHDITTTGLIDENYRGEILVKLHNHGYDSYLVEAGERIAQLVVVPVMYEDLEFVDEMDMETERGVEGFGSTGK